MARGPSYPYVGLEEAINLARKTYDYAKRGSAPVDAIVADAWKYSTTSSSGQKILAALKSFGLVEDGPGTAGKAIKLTQRAIRILLDDTDSVERQEEIKAAALSPKSYAHCWKTWGKDMPQSMRSNLLIEHGFVDTTVDAFLRDYRKTIAFAGLLNDAAFGKREDSKNQSDEQPKVGEYVQWESQGILRMPEAKKLTGFSENGQFAFVEGSLTGIPVGELINAEAPDKWAGEAPGVKLPSTNSQVAKRDSKMHLDTLSLADGITLQFQWPTSISQEAYDDFLYQLEGVKKRVGRAVQKGVAAEAQSES